MAPATEAQIAWRERNIERIRREDRQRQAASRSLWSEDRRARHRKATLRYHHAKGRFRKYGITKADYEQMLADQGGVCKTCARPAEDSRGGTLVIDHSHVTGVVRALLCHNCNVVLGLVSENPDVLTALSRLVGTTSDAPSSQEFSLG